MEKVHVLRPIVTPQYVIHYTEERLAVVIYQIDLVTKEFFSETVLHLRAFNKVAMADLARALNAAGIEASSMLVYAWSLGRDVPDDVCRRVNILSEILMRVRDLYDRD